MTHSARMAAVLGLLGVALGAFGAHGLQALLTANGTLGIWQTAVQYQLIHGVAALWASERAPRVAWLWLAGVVVFSGSLYALALTQLKWLGVLTPLGGILFLTGWALLIVRPAAARC